MPFTDTATGERGRERAVRTAGLAKKINARAPCVDLRA